MILSPEQLATFAKELDASSPGMPYATYEVKNLLDTIADLKRQLAERDAKLLAPIVSLIEKWDEVILAFTSSAYTVHKPMNAVQVLKDARFDLETAINEATNDSHR